MATQAGSLPLRRNHESGFRNVGRRVDEIGRVPDHMTVLTGAVDCYKGCVELVVRIAKLLDIIRRQGPDVAEKARISIILRQSIKQRLDVTGVQYHGRPDRNLPSVP